MPFPDGSGLEHEPWTAAAMRRTIAMEGMGSNHLVGPQPVIPMPDAVTAPGMAPIQMGSDQLPSLAPQAARFGNPLTRGHSSIRPVQPQQTSPAPLSEQLGPALPAAAHVPAATPVAAQTAGEALTGTVPLSDLSLSAARGGVDLSAAVETLHLADSSTGPQTKLKCPKCDTVQAAGNKKCTNCGHDLTDARKAKFAKLNAAAPWEGCNGHECIITYPDAPEMKLAVEVEQDPRSEPGKEQGGLVWKIACKTGSMALSPGPGQIDVEKPLVLTADLFSKIKYAFDDGAFPHVTVPETHANLATENTGYVRAVDHLSKDEALLDARVPEKAKQIIQSDPVETRYLLTGIEFTEPGVRQRALNGSIPDTSFGVKFNWRRKIDGKSYDAAMEHLALTPVPWRDGLGAFGNTLLSGQPFDADDIDYRYDGVFVPAEIEIDGNILSEDESPDTIQTSASAIPSDPGVSDTMARTVEEVLAESKAQQDAQATQIAELIAANEKLASNLQEATVSLSATTEDLHTRKVNTRIGEWQGAGVAPSVCVAAQQLLMGKQERKDDGSLMLSVQTGVKDGEPEITEIGGVAGVIEHLLAAMPVGQDAARIAHTMEHLDEITLSGRPGAGGQEDKLKALDTWEKETHPDRFNEDGTRKNPVTV